VTDIKPPFNPVDIYDRYLKLQSDEKQIERKKALKNRYAASSAGLCKRKHWYAYNDYVMSENDADLIRKMKLGTLVGQDFDDAMNWMYTNLKETGDIHFNPDLEIIIEGEVANKEFNILGHFDLLVIKDKKGYLYDYKTCHEWTFKKATGKILSKQNDKDNYAYQLGTYAFMIEESPDYDCDEIVYMENIYVNKNDSKVKCKQIDLRYKEFAKEYWSSVNRNQVYAVPPPFGLHQFTPAYNWECVGYCNFTKHCDSPYKKSKGK
tara:strand:+ start:161 stop:952 length:792 start_codon:yes stop_codon:yes gene_type:complete